MSHGRIRFTLVVALLVAGCASSAFAQPLLADVPIKTGKLYWVTRTDGMEVKGFITERTDTELRISGERGPLAVPVSDVLMIAKPDGLKEGFLVGMLTGVTMVVVQPDDPDYGSGAKAAFAAYFGLAFGGIGALVDKMVGGRDVVYRQPGTVSVSLAPVLSGGRRGIGAVLRW